MSFSETFDSDLGGYTGNGAASWQNGAGFPTQGCCKLVSYDGVVNSGEIGRTDTHTIIAGDKLYCYYRIFDASGSPDGNDLLIATIDIDSGADSDTQSVMSDDINTDDSGWQLLSFDLTPWVGQALTGVFFSTPLDDLLPPAGTPTEFYAYVDGIVVTDTPPPAPGLTYGLTHSAGGIPGAIAV